MKAKKSLGVKKVLILGAGLAGLAAGYELTKANFQVIVVERENDVGGLARTIEKKGFRFDTGPHRWYTKNNMVNDWMLRLLGREVIKVPRLTRIYFNHKFIHYPIKIKSTLVNIGAVKTAQAVLDYLWVRVKNTIRPQKPISLEDGYISKFGNTLYQLFFKKYSERLWGRSCRKISADWIGQRTRGFNITTILKDLLLKKRNVVSFVDEFSYPEKGIGRLAQKMAEEIKRQGGQVLLNHSVKQVSHKQSKVNTVSIVSSQKIKKIKADEYISTIAISDLVKSLHPQSPQKVLSSNKRLEYRNEILVALFVNKTHLTKDTWVYVHVHDLPFIRFMEMDNWSKKLSPKGKTAIVFELACNHGDAVWNKKDQELVDLVSSAFIREFKLITHQDILGFYVHRAPKEYPVYHLGYKKDLTLIKKYLSTFSNLQIAGRNGIFRYNNMDHSIEMGLYAAWNIIAGEKKHDIESVNIEREYLEEKRNDEDKLEISIDQYVKKK